MNPATVAFLRSAYKEYYFKKADSMEFPPEIQSREFGYIPFGGSMIRHLSFRSSGEAIVELVRQAPSSAYCSNARYTAPTLPVEEKGWLGAELIFDIDATDIPTACKKSHDIWYCESCHSKGKLPKPPACPACKGVLQEFHGTCDECLEAARQHALRVVDFLTKDFGASADAIRTYFSGSRGYHLHVFDARFDPLDQQGRAEIAEYIRGSSLPASNTIWASLRRTPPNSEDLRGWTRRIAAAVGYVPGEASQRKSVAQAIASQAARIDSSVTTDIHRVFRLAGTLHGTSGMLKMRVDSSDDFDPTADPVVLSDRPVRIQVSFFPAFKMKGETFGPYKSESVSVPTYAAIGILTRGLAEVS
ncbi:MAG TPA: DNA primase small subunit domain-containing protein [Nitrososphaerales archaeon]|nr:DNA primase small subunit domain-containing protein [Nitrososphaerales archaeon]